jgi:hypothetical protein
VTAASGARHPGSNGWHDFADPIVFGQPYTPWALDESEERLAKPDDMPPPLPAGLVTRPRYPVTVRGALLRGLDWLIEGRRP